MVIWESTLLIFYETRNETEETGKQGNLTIGLWYAKLDTKKGGKNDKKLERAFALYGLLRDGY